MPMKKNSFITLNFLFFSTIVFSETLEKNPAITAEIPINDIQHYTQYSDQQKKLIQAAHALTQQNLTYTYGSSTPANKGMDCSGTIYYLLNTVTHLDVPRQANEMYLWAEKEGRLHFTNTDDFQSEQFKDLQPGDLLFWSGTYAVNRTPPITHVMLYLGKNIENNPLMFGSSDGRTYLGEKMRGVSIFDFKLPKSGDKAHFVGYSCIPNYTCAKK